MTYRHAKKAGNRSDVWKHFILTETLEALLSRTPATTSFRYFETHGGPGIYRLEQNGEWRTGAAVITRTGQALSDNSYIRHLGRPSPGNSYPGSWVLAGRVLLEHGRLPILEICDIDPQIELAPSDSEIPAAIRHNLVVHRGDGFELLGRAVRPDFALIDPPYTPDPDKDWAQAISAAKRLETEKVAGLIWYPVLRCGRRMATGTDIEGYETIWGPQAGRENLIGCGILGTGPARKCLLRLTDRMRLLADAIGAQFRRTRPGI